MSGEVRLWRHNYDTDFRARHLMLSDDDAQRAGITPYIALPIARHAALMRVVEAAVAAAPDWLPDDIGAATEAVVANAQRIALGLVRLGRAITATAPGRQGEAPR